jgi:hypothetical protein
MVGKSTTDGPVQEGLKRVETDRNREVVGAKTGGNRAKILAETESQALAAALLFPRPEAPLDDPSLPVCRFDSTPQGNEHIKN